MISLRQRAAASGLPSLLLRFWTWLVVSTACSLLFTSAMILLLHNRFAYGILVLWNDGFFWDLMVFEERFKHFRTPAFWDVYFYPFSYPAAMGVAMAGLFRIPHLLRWYLLACVASFLVWAWLAARAIASRCSSSFYWTLAFTLTIVSTAWPVWLLLCSANTEGLVWVLVALGLWAMLRRRWWFAATLIALAGSLKIFPLALLALLLSRRRYKEFAYALCLTLLLTLASLAILGPSVLEAQRHVMAGLTFVKYTYALAVTQYAPDVSHSLFSPIKFAVALLYRAMHASSWRGGQLAVLTRAYSVYLAAVCVFFVLVYMLKIRRMPMLNQILALTVLAVLLPPYSVDYTLLHLLVPLALLLAYVASRRHRGAVIPGARACLICFAWIFPICTFFTLHYRFGSLMRSFALMALFVCVLRWPFVWDELDGDAPFALIPQERV